MKKIPCPACPDGAVWTKDGPTTDTCPTCRGEAFIWIYDAEDDPDKWLANMSDQERRGWMRARDEEVD